MSSFIIGLEADCQHDEKLHIGDAIGSKKAALLAFPQRFRPVVILQVLICLCPVSKG